MSRTLKSPDGRTVTVGAGCKHWGKQEASGFTRPPCRNCPARGQLGTLRSMVASGEWQQLTGKGGKR